MFGNRYDEDQDERIRIDRKAVKDELKDLTTEQRRIILEEYQEMVLAYGVGVKEYKEFVRFF
jgi:riboflavin synthase